MEMELIYGMCFSLASTKDDWPSRYFPNAKEKKKDWTMPYFPDKSHHHHYMFSDRNDMFTVDPECDDAKVNNLNSSLLIAFPFPDL